MLRIAIYHFNVKVVSRGKNASAVAKAAYISGETIKNSYDGVAHDYRKKKEIVHKEILLPTNAPPEFMKRSVLWNAVEQAEKRKNSQTAKHIDAALPVEISRAEQIDLVRNFCQQCFVSKGMCADFAIHDKGDGMLKRLTAAKRMLMNDTAPGEVCVRCGFRDYTSFFRAFKAEYGISPRDYASQLS